MSLADALNTDYQPPRIGGECSIGKLYRASTDDPAGQAALLAILADTEVEHVEVAAKLAAYGIGAHTVSRHRRGLCKCGQLDG